MLREVMIGDLVVTVTEEYNILYIKKPDRVFKQSNDQEIEFVLRRAFYLAGVGVGWDSNVHKNDLKKIGVALNLQWISSLYRNELFNNSMSVVPWTLNNITEVHALVCSLTDNGISLTETQLMNYIKDQLET